MAPSSAPAAPTGPTATSSTLTSPTPPAVPVRLRIAAIGVDAPVVPVGVEPNGDMEVPGASDVGWYRFGPTPGATGSAVLAAHVDYDGRPGAFFALRQVRPGATIEVDLGAGGVRRFRAVRSERVAKTSLPTGDVFSRDGAPRLALITCGGAFDQSARSYADNVVVFAEPQP
jgi:sortase (surface protein transpeptidase)